MAAVFISFASDECDQARALSGFLKERNVQSIFLDRDERDGIAPGATWQRELYREVRACEIMVVLWSKHYADSRWCFFERTLAATWGKRFLPVILDDTPLVPELASAYQAVPRSASDRWQRVVDGLERLAIGSRVAFPWDRLRPPYPGLMSFDVADARVFFGREREVQAVLDIVSKVSRHERGGWVVLVGPSGCGKSSILRAGVVARLQLETKAWDVAPPIRAGELNTTKLDELVPPAAGDTSRTLIVALDQLEELFDEQNVSAAANARLVRLRDWAATDRVVCVGTLRADYHAHFQRLASKLDLRFRTLPIESFPLPALERVISGPAEVAALEVDPKLLARLLHDASADSLPLLAFALREVYERGDRLSLSEDIYNGLEGLDGAAAKVADRVLASHGLDAARQAQFLETLVRLVRVNDNDEPIRRPLLKSEIPAELGPLFQDLVDNRLLVVSEAQDPVVELSHEALIRAWKPLCDIVAGEREFLIWHRRLQVFMSAGAAPDAGEDLLHGHTLSEAQAWLKKHPRRLTSAERDLINHSADANQAELARKLRDAEELASTKSAATRSLQIGVVVALVLAVAAIAIAYWAFRQKDAAEAASASASDKATRLLAYKLIQASDDVLLTDRKLALVLAIEAYDRDQSVSIRRRIFAASMPSIRTGGHWGPIVAADWSPSDDVVATASDDGSIRIWQVDGQLDRVLTDDDTAFQGIDFSASGQYLASLSKDGSVRIWTRDGKPSVPIEPGRDLESFQWAPKDELLVVTSKEGQAVYDVRGKAVVPWTAVAVTQGLISIPGPYFSPDGARLATATASGIHLLTLTPTIKATEVNTDIRPEALRWQSADTLLITGHGGSALVQVDGRVLWHDSAIASLPGFFLAGYPGEFLTATDVPPGNQNRLVLHDAAGNKLRELPSEADDNCGVQDGTVYCARKDKVFADGVPVDFGYRLSSISGDGGRAVIVGLSKTGALCKPRGHQCLPLAQIPEDLRDASTQGELPFALGMHHALVAHTKKRRADILSYGGATTPVDGDGDFEWLSNDGFVRVSSPHCALYGPDGNLRTRFDCDRVYVSPSRSLIASVSLAARTIVFHDRSGSTIRSIPLAETKFPSMSWGAQDRDFAYQTSAASFVVDPTSGDSPLEQPLGGLHWSPKGRDLALVSSDFSGGARRGTVTLLHQGAAPEVILSGSAFDAVECPNCSQRVLGWSPGGRYFAICFGEQGLAAEVKQPHDPIKVPCEARWSADDAWFTAPTKEHSEQAIQSMPGGKVMATFPNAATLEWSPNEARLAVLDQLDLSLWTPSEGLKKVAKVPDAGGEISFSPTGKDLVWTRSTRGLMVDHQGSAKDFYFPGPIARIKWSPDGRLLAAAQDAFQQSEPNGGGETLKTYVINTTGELVAQLAGRTLSWSTTNQRLGLTLGHEQRVWLMTDAGVAEARRSVDRTLTPNERQRYGLPTPAVLPATR